MPFLRPHARKLDRHVSHKSLEASHYNKGALADSSDFGLLGEQSSQKWEIPSLRCQWTAAQNFTPLALSSAEKSVTKNTPKTGHFRDVLHNQSLSMVLKKLNLMLPSQTCINKPKDIIMQNKHEKPTARSACLVRIGLEMKNTGGGGYSYNPEGPLEAILP